MCGLGYVCLPKRFGNKMVWENDKDDEYCLLHDEKTAKRFGLVYPRDALYSRDPRVAFW